MAILVYKKHHLLNRPFFFHFRTELEKEKSAINDLSQQKGESCPVLLQKEHQGLDDLVHPNIVENSAHAHGELTVKSKAPQAQPRKRGDPTNSGRSQPPVSSSQEQRRGKPIHPNDNLSDLSGYQDAEEEEDIDDYFQMIENAISDKKPQVIAGARKTSDIQRQLFNKEDKEQGKVTDYAMQKGQVSAALRQIDIYNQNQIQQTKNMPAKNYPNAYSQRSAAETVKEKNDLNIFEQDKARPSKKDFYETNDSDYARKDPQYIIQPPDQKPSGQATTGESKQGYDKLLLHELTPDTRQPSAKHYLEEHKTQPVSYEAFSSAKAMQQMQTDPRQQTKVAPNKSYQQTKDAENRNQQNYYYGQLSSTTSTSKPAEDSTNGDGQKSSALDLQNQKKPKPPKPEPQDWSPVSDLSPILDVSPSIEAAEQVFSFV